MPFSRNWLHTSMYRALWLVLVKGNTLFGHVIQSVYTSVGDDFPGFQFGALHEVGMNRGLERWFSG